VQNPSDALSPAMPEAGIGLMTPDRILTLEVMASCLNKMRRTSIAALSL
jgi:hypothetical protein